MAHTSSAGGRGVNYGRLQLSEDELRVLRECARESFWMRSLPAAGAMSMLMMRLIASGRVTASSRTVAAVKVTLAGSLGYVLGKATYVGVTRERILALPDSRLADAMRGKYSGSGGAGGGDAPWMNQSPRGFGDGGGNFESQPADNSWSDDEHTAPAAKRHDAPAGLDDYYRPSLDSPSVAAPASPLSPPDVSHQSPPVSYSQLREQNRAEFDSRRRAADQSRWTGASSAAAQHGLMPPQQQQPAIWAPSGGQEQQQQPSVAPSQRPQFEPYRKPPPKTNAYGDTWEA